MITCCDYSERLSDGLGHLAVRSPANASRSAVPDDGRLLALGLPPALPATWVSGSATPGPRSFPAGAYSPRVWAFTLRTRTWAVAAEDTMMPCQDVSSCYLCPLGMTRTSAGAYIWLMDTGPSVTNAIYRVFVLKR